MDRILENEGIEALYGYLRRCDSLNENDAVGVDIMTPDSVLEPSPSVLSTSNSSGFVTNAVVSNPMALLSTATTATTESGREEGLVVVPRKKRTPKFDAIRVDPGLSYGPDGLHGCSGNVKVNRRKRTPERSALA